MTVTVPGGPADRAVNLNLTRNVAHQCPKSTYVFSPPLSHCFARALFRIAIVRCLLAALLAMPILASSLAHCFLIIAQSCFVPRSLMQSRFSCFSILTAWGAWSARELFFISMFDHRLCTLALCYIYLLEVSAESTKYNSLAFFARFALRGNDCTLMTR